MNLKGPNFFIVGAPKCGTTAMNHFLAQHPDIFMAQKEVHYFGSDLKMRSVPSEAQYLHYFQGAGEEKVRGEASVWYLYSKTAAQEIKAFCPEAKILIMLRNPVEVLYSLHSQHLYNYNEDVRDFKKALALDQDRKEGKNLPDSVDFSELPPYFESVKFLSQVERYFQIFGRENVHLVLYDDFKRDPQREVEKTLAFLGLSPQETIDYQVINPNKKIRSWPLHRVLKKPSARLKKWVRRVVPSKKIRHALMASLFKVNIYFRKRKNWDEPLKRELTQRFSSEIQDLGRLIGRDLSSWTK